MKLTCILLGTMTILLSYGFYQHSHRSMPIPAVSSLQDHGYTKQPAGSNESSAAVEPSEAGETHVVTVATPPPVPPRMAAQVQSAAVVQVKSPAPLSVAEVVALLQSGSASFDRKQAELARMKQSGMLKEVTAQLEQQAAANPDQAQTLAALGQAYMKQVAGMEDLREQALLALKADQILESSLNLDPSNWEARFIKTVGMSYWPPQMNKNQDVLDQFQLLIRQQETESVRPEFVRSYLRLGDQYATGGQAEYARAVWQRGMEYFPDSAELKNRLRSQQ